jgi:hypothetical protein
MVARFMAPTRVLGDALVVTGGAGIAAAASARPAGRRPRSEQVDDAAALIDGSGRNGRNQP